MRVERIVVTELPPDDLTPEPWTVAWTNALGNHTRTHDSKRAAQTHVREPLEEPRGRSKQG